MTETAVSGQLGGDEPAVLDTPQQFTEASSYRVRDELQALIERDLLGPWDGENEVLPPRSQGPGERYLVGRLGPRQSTGSGKEAAQDTASVDTDIAAGGDGADPELPDLLTMQNAGRMWASSMGLSCVVDAETDILTVVVTWGQYAKSEVHDDEGHPAPAVEQAAGQVRDPSSADRAGPQVSADLTGCVPGGCRAGTCRSASRG